MQFIESDHAKLHRLRVVFGDAVVWYNLAADATFGEIAQRLDEPSSRRHGNPVAIDVTFHPGPADPARQASRRPGRESLH